MMPAFNHTLDIKKEIEFIIASLAIIILVRTNYKSIGPQNGVNPHEHVNLILFWVKHYLHLSIQIK